MLLLSILNLASRLTTSSRRVKTRCPADLDEGAIGERCPDGRQEVGSEPRLDDIAEPAHLLGEVGVVVDSEEDETGRLVPN